MRAQLGHALDIPQDRAAGHRVEVAAGRPAEARGGRAEIADRLAGEVDRRPLSPGKEGQESDEVVASVKAGDRAPGRAVPGLAGNRDRQRRVDGGDVADDARLHLHDALALAGVRDLQDPAPPVVRGQPEVLVTLADERGGSRTNAEDVGGDRRSFLETEPRRGHPKDVAGSGPCGLHWHVALL